MEFCVQWVTSDPEKEFWDFFDEDPGLPKELWNTHFRKPETVPVENSVGVFYALLCTERQIPAAGGVFIYFPQSSSVLIRHIFIKDEFRREFDLDGINPSYEKLLPLFSKKRGETSEKDGLPHLLRKIREKAEDKERQIFVFAETIDVELAGLPPEEHKRLNKLHRFYATIKGKRVETTEYNRPKIGREFFGLPLSLVNFPEFHGEPFLIKISEVLPFVQEYQQFVSTEGKSSDDIANWSEEGELMKKIKAIYKTVTWEQIEQLGLANNDLEKLLFDLLKKHYPVEEPSIYLRELPRLEEAKLAFHRASVCFELMVDEDYYEPVNIDPAQKFYKIRDEEREMNWLGERFPWLPNMLTRKRRSTLSEEEKAFMMMSREEKTKHILKNGYCIVHHSFETDLLAYKHQANPPFFTKSYRQSKLVSIRFPDATDFISEGRKERFYTPSGISSGDVKMHCFVNYSYFLNSRMRVWHIVLRSSEDHPVSEFDIIKLMKFFGGSQESISETEKKENELPKIRFKVGREHTGMHDFLGFFKQVSGVAYAKRKNLDDSKPIDPKLTLLKNLKTGIVQLDAEYLEPATLVTYLRNAAPSKAKEKLDDDHEISAETLNWDLRRYHKDLYEENLAGSDGDEEFPYHTIQYILKAYCGIVLGLLDFERMGWQEVNDTLKPQKESLDKTYYLTVNRGVITSYSLKDNVLNSTLNTLGINPYLVVPSAVLVHNEYVSSDADERLTRVLERCRVDSTNAIELGELIGERNYIDDLINDDILSNVFQYPSEQELYDYGMKHRGIIERINDTRAKLNQLDKIIEQIQSQKSIQNEKWIQTGLGVLSLLQLVSVAADYIGISTLDREYCVLSMPLIPFLWLLICTSLLMLVYVSFFRSRKVRIRKPKKNGK